MTTIDQLRDAALKNPSLFSGDFYHWIADNHHVFTYFEECACRVWDSGFKHYSARTIVEVMRHRSNVREIGDGTWKLNNNRVPDMAKLYMLLHPEQQGLFEFRRKAA